jgi:hypothetical protein
VHLLIGTIIVSIKAITKCFSQLLTYCSRENIVDLAYGIELLAYANELLRQSIVLNRAHTLSIH